MKRIAERAGLRSPALIARSFKAKDALREAVREHLKPVRGEVVHLTPVLGLPPGTVLERSARAFLQAAEQPATGRLLRVLRSQATFDPTVASRFASHGPLVLVGFRERPLAHPAALGRLRLHNPPAAAWTFMGMLVAYPLGRLVVAPLGAGFPPASDDARQMVQLFLNGLAPDGGIGRRRHRAGAATRGAPGRPARSHRP